MLVCGIRCVVHHHLTLERPNVGKRMYVPCDEKSTNQYSRANAHQATIALTRTTAKILFISATGDRNTRRSCALHSHETPQPHH